MRINAASEYYRRQKEEAEQKDRDRLEEQERRAREREVEQQQRLMEDKRLRRQRQMEEERQRQQQIHLQQQQQLRPTVPPAGAAPYSVSRSDLYSRSNVIRPPHHQSTPLVPSSAVPSGAHQVPSHNQHQHGQGHEHYQGGECVILLGSWRGKSRLFSCIFEKRIGIRDLFSPSFVGFNSGSFLMPAKMSCNRARHISCG